MKVSVLGATGSVGRAALAVIARFRDKFSVSALCAERDVAGLAAAATSAGADFAAIADKERLGALRDALAGTRVECGAGPSAVREAAARDADRVVCAIAGHAGLSAVMTAMVPGRVIALANKEVLVCAGPVMRAAIARNDVTLIPIDSEHNAIFQVLDHPERVRKLVLTASGGPFRDWSRKQMQRAEPEQACRHPNWKMGPKISVDSATMMNKALECVEAVYLFAIDPGKIEVLVHRQSIVHGLVEYVDGSVLAQLSCPDMRVPIAHALAWPERLDGIGSPALDLAAIARLGFERPDEERFPALALGRRALQARPVGPLVASVANEVAVEAFLDRRLGFADIVPFVARMMDEILGGRHGAFSEPTDIDSVEVLIATVDRLARSALRP